MDGKFVMPDGNVTFTGKWRKGLHNVVYIYQGTVPENAPKPPVDPSAYPVGEMVSVLPEPTLEGYTFSGWYAGTELVTAETVNQLTDDLHLTARWTQKTNITYVVEHWMEYVASGVNPGYSGQTLQIR